MNGRRIGVLVAALLVAGLSIARMAMAGGFGLFVELPRAEHDARLKESVLVYHAAGCHAVNDLRWEAKFEGMVNGKRVTLPLDKVAKVTRVPHSSGGQRYPGMDYYGISRPTLPEGKWVLSLTVISEETYPEIKNGKATDRKVNLTITQLVPFRADGTPVTRANPGAKHDTAIVTHHVKQSEREKTITQLLKAPAASSAVAATAAPR